MGQLSSPLRPLLEKKLDQSITVKSVWQGWPARDGAFNASVQVVPLRFRWQAVPGGPDCARLFPKGHRRFREAHQGSPVGTHHRKEKGWLRSTEGPWSGV